MCKIITAKPCCKKWLRGTVSQEINCEENYTWEQQHLCANVNKLRANTAVYQAQKQNTAVLASIICESNFPVLALVILFHRELSRHITNVPQCVCVYARAAIYMVIPGQRLIDCWSCGAAALSRSRFKCQFAVAGTIFMENYNAITRATVHMRAYIYNAACVYDYYVKPPTLLRLYISSRLSRRSKCVRAHKILYL